MKDEKLAQLMEDEGIDESQEDACRAYLEAGISDDLENFSEAYQGRFADNEVFAREIAEVLDLLDDDIQWPYNSVNWERAARELMMDYTAQDGYYFRSI